jgi:hypothetical protein
MKKPVIEEPVRRSRSRRSAEEEESGDDFTN